MKTCDYIEEKLNLRVNTKLYHSKGTECDLSHFISVLSSVQSKAFKDKSGQCKRLVTADEFT